MGMAASQARYLALVARKSNCEYEGQQINQARLNLSNQTANLFNQMLGLNVPTPPSTQDYTKVQYSFSDGVNSMTMDSWQQLATPEEDYNYVINYHYKSNVYTGSQKKLNDPQVQFSGALPTSSAQSAEQIKAIKEAQEAIVKAQKSYDETLAEYKAKVASAGELATYADNSLNSHVIDYKKNGTNYEVYIQDTTKDGYPLYTIPAIGTTPAVEVYYNNGKYYNKDDGSEYKGETTGIQPNVKDTRTYTPVNDIKNDELKSKIKEDIDLLKKNGAIKEDFDLNNVYYDEKTGTIAFKSDLDALISSSGTGSGTSTILPSYHTNDAKKGKSDTWVSIEGMQAELKELSDKLSGQKAVLEMAQATYDAMSVPSYIGNCQLTSLNELSEDQIAEIKQIIKDMQAQGIETNLTKCFNTMDGTFDASTYSGGIYSFTMNGTTYYTTYYDLAEAANSGEGINHIDNQQKLPYYNASYVSTNINKTDKALLETDGNGRFVSVRIGDDTLKYTLHAETITDDAAYQDAMNQYYYENAQYDKMIQDINAKTSLIQQEDQQLELRLKQLDTEQNALATEIDAVSKVVKDNVEKSFKTFGG